MDEVALVGVEQASDEIRPESPIRPATPGVSPVSTARH